MMLITYPPHPRKMILAEQWDKITKGTQWRNQTNDMSYVLATDALRQTTLATLYGCVHVVILAPPQCAADTAGTIFSQQSGTASAYYRSGHLDSSQ